VSKINVFLEPQAQVAISPNGALWGAQQKTLDMSAFFHCAPFRLLARCAYFPRIIEEVS
jgi:hypothetical protein